MSHLLDCFETIKNGFGCYITYYDNERVHQGKSCQGGTPMQTFMDGKNLLADKNLDDGIAA
jgi:hypothetical protein